VRLACATPAEQNLVVDRAEHREQRAQCDEGADKSGTIHAVRAPGYPHQRLID
jgi:hypothetical protein